MSIKYQFSKGVAICTFLLFINLQTITAQVGIGTQTPEAALDVVSANAGVLIPRFSLSSITDISLITNPNGGSIATSTLIFNDGLGALSEAGFYFWNGSNWALVGSSGVETRAIRYESANTATNIHVGGIGRLPLFGTEIFNDDPVLFTVLPDDATIQITEAGRYRISVNVYVNLDEAEGLAMAIFDVNGPAGVGNLVFPSRNGAAGVGNPAVTFGGFNFVTQTAAGQLKLSTVLDFDANARFCIGAARFGTVSGAGFVTLRSSASGEASTVIIEKVN